MRQYLLGISLALALAGSTLAAAPPKFPVIADNGGIPLTVTADTQAARRTALLDWLKLNCPELDLQRPATEHLIWLLAHWTQSQPDGSYRLVGKYANLGFSAYTKVLALTDVLTAQGLPDAYVRAWEDWYAQRLVAWRLEYDLPAETAMLNALPRAGQAVTVTDALSLTTVLTRAYPDWPQQTPLVQARYLHALAAINPALRPLGWYRTGGEAMPATPADVMVCAVPMPAGGQHIWRWQVLPQRAIYLPPATWLATTAAVELPQLDSASIPPAQFTSFTITGLPAEVPATVQISTHGDQVPVATVILPSYNNRVYPMIPQSLVLPEADQPIPALSVRNGQISGNGRFLLPGRRTPTAYNLVITPKTESTQSTATLYLEIPGKSGPVQYRKVGSAVLPAAPAQPPATTALAAGTSWPIWNGPQGNGLADPCGKRLVSDLEDAALAWVADEWIPDGRGADTRGKIRSVVPGEPLMGGWATPVVADNKVVLSYYEPSGKDYAYGAGARVTQDPATASSYRANLIRADDVVHCFDATTGRTLWKRRFADAGVNWAGFNKGGPQASPALGGGLVYSLGTLGQLTAVSLADGAVRWVTDIGPRYEQMRQIRRNLIASNTMLSTRSDFQSNVIYADGTVVVSDQRRTKLDYRYELEAGLIGLDARTGHQLWHLPEVAGGRFNEGAHLLRLGGQSYILVSGNDGTRLLAPATGKVYWHAPELVLRSVAFAFAGDLVIGDQALTSKNNDKLPGGLVALRVTPEKYTVAWRLENGYGRLGGGGCQVQDYLYLPVNAPQNCIVVVVPATGKVVNTLPVPKASDGEHCPYLIGSDAQLWTPTDRTDGLLSIPADPAQMAAGLRLWPADLATGYCGSLLPAVVDGRMFIRTTSRLLCYDLRAEQAPQRAHGQLWPRTNIVNRTSAPPAKDIPAD
jgi:outer membrane protein assembly factor BamB